MGILDALGSINPFKKKDDFGLAPLDQNEGFQQQNFQGGFDSPNFDTGHSDFTSES